MEKLENSYTVDGNVNDEASLENSLAVTQTFKHRVTLWPNNSTPKRIENMFMQNLNTDVHSNVIDNAQNVETTQMSTNQKMDTCYINWHKKDAAGITLKMLC